MAVRKWGDFEVDLGSPLGRGGMGAVYRGRQTSLDRPAAIKILKKELTENPDFVKRFNREAAMLAKLVDIHVVQVFGAGEADGQHYYAMEYVEGDDFSVLIKKGHRFSVEEVLQVALSVGAALQAAWRHRIIHRDIKPSNILKTKDGEIKVMDFGLAKNPDTDLTASEMIMGTAKYMSPEQATGAPCDIRSDLYSLGVVLFELATGRPPFQGESATSMMYLQVHQAPPKPRSINAQLPEAVEALILRLLEKKPEARFATPEALIAAVRGVQEGVDPEERSTLYNETVMTAGRPDSSSYAETIKLGAAPSSGARPAAGKGKRVWTALLILVLLGGGAGAAFYSARNGAPPEAPGRPVAQAPVPDPKPAADPLPPPPVPVPAVASFEEARLKGLEAFGDKKWALAFTLLEEAERLGAKDVAERKRQARANEQIDKGDAEPDEETALVHYEAALKILDDEAIRQKIRRTTFRRWRKSAERNEGGDWSRAVADWKRALEQADPSQAEETKDRLRFCELFEALVAARTTKDWPKALEVGKALAQSPRGFSVAVEAEIKRAEAEMAMVADAAAKELRGEFEELLAAGRQALAKASWAEAKAVFQRTLEPRFKGFPSAESELALGAPAGMIYVPGGRFRMGGGRPVESPEGEAEVAAFYLDERETRAGEYAEYLKSLDSFGHHPGCLKAEPPNKKHEPQDWSDQDPSASVTGVDWWDATSYAAWKRKRLPSEAEWERAASFDPVSGRRAYAWGPRWLKEGGRSYLGLEGMGTGVMEWTSDWFNRYAWSPAEHSDFGEKKKVLRGGVLLAEDAQENARAGYRHWYFPAYRSRKVGFRCAQDVEPR
jgi:formylglycine-generating enzyme required for sulfatase activity/predicted Ser/Thr protein kinase